MGLYNDFLKQINKRIDENKVKQENSNRRAYNSDRGTEIIKNSILPNRKEYTSSESVNNNVNLPIAEEFKRQLENGKRVQPNEKYSLPVFSKHVKKDTLPMASKVIGSSLINNTSYVGKKTGAGVLSGATGIVQAGTTDFANNVNKGKRKSSSELIGDTLNGFGSIVNPVQGVNNIATKIPTFAVKTIKTLQDKNSTGWEKMASLGTSAVHEALNDNSARKLFDSVSQGVGKLLPKNAGNKILEVGDKIAEPSNSLNQKLEGERYNYGKITQVLGDVGQVVGNMVPSIAVGTVTKNPNMALATMGVSAKGQATQEALSKGASLDEAIKIGDTKGAIEIGTEMLTGGVNVFGKGAIDDIVEKGIVSKVKNKVANFFVKQGVNITGEVLEETISDILGTAIDRGTVDPNASYSWQDFGDTAITTMLSTLVLNAITGGAVGIGNKLQQNVQNKQSLLPTQQIIQEQNKLAQNENMEQLLPIANNGETLYNTNESEGGMNEREQSVLGRYVSNEQGGIENLYSQKDAREQGQGTARIDTRTEESIVGRQNKNDAEAFYRKYEKQAREHKLTITTEQQQIANYAKSRYGKDLIFFDDSNTKFGGGLSKTDKTSIFFGDNAIKQYGESFLLGHEIGEDMLANHNDVVKDAYNNLKERIQNDTNFPDIFLDYIYNIDEDLKSLYIEHPEAIAKELICDTLGFMQNDNELGNNLQHKDIKDVWVNRLDSNLLNEMRQTLKKCHDEIYPNNLLPVSDRSDLADIKVPTREYFENKETSQFLSDEDLNVLNKIYEKEGTTEVFTEKKKAKILEKYAKDKYSFKDSLDMLAQKVVNKGHYVDELSKSSKNPELKFMYDRNLNSFAEGQYVVGIAQTDNNGNAIGKSINDIWKPIEDSKLSKEFDEYLLHKLNIDRAERNKYVFGEDIKPADSTAIALDLEAKHPEFKEWAKDIKEFNHNNMLNLKEAGLIDEDTINYLESMYPNYVPISRTVDEQIFTGNADKTGTALPVKSATGGNADIQPVKDAMAMQAIRIKKLINQNNLGIELAKSLKNAKVEESFDTTFTPSVLLEMDTLVETDSSGNKFYTYFEDGKMQKLKINDNLYKSLKPTVISDIEKTLPARCLQKLTNINRSLLTSINPLFTVINFFKDFQDGMYHSNYSSKFIKNYGKALNEIVTNGKYYESYMANGGMTNSYFDYEEGVKKKPNKFVQKIRDANEIVEQLPRLAEFISTIEDGKSLNEALYNAAEITTNFKRGGEWTKALNRNGATFLNASVQGFDKFYRNFSGQNGVKGYVNLVIKASLLGVVPSVLNHILLDDDEDYQNLPQSTKDLYYLFKYDDGKFVRIPKGRVLSVFGAVARRTVESVQGQDDVWDGLGDTVINQIAPNNPVEDNVFAPIGAVASNKTWYGSDLVSSRLQKELPKNQYDETTDEFSKWIGNNLNVSPKKVNYLLDQYSGGIGDVLLPMITPQAKENVVVDKFTTDSVLKNKNVSKFYDTLDKQTQIANDSFATDKDRLQLKYLNEKSQDIGKLYKEKRDIQMSNISQAEKRNKVREVQGKIDVLCEEALKNYKDIKVEGNTAKSKFSSFYKDSEGEWKELTEDEESKNKDISLKSYADYKNTVYEKKQSKIKSGELKKGQDLKDKDKIQVLLDSNYSNKEISAIYENYILSSNNKSFKAIKASGIDIKVYLKYVQQEFKADKTDDGTTKGKTVSNSKKSKSMTMSII